MTQPNQIRDDEIIASLEEGVLSHALIAKRFNVSSVKVRQLNQIRLALKSHQ